MSIKNEKYWYFQFKRTPFFILSLICTITIFISPSHAQIIRQFTATPETFITELEQFLVSSHQEKGEALVAKFNKLWKDDKIFTMDQQRQIMRTSNQMLSQRLKAFPDFENYINALISYMKGGLPKSVFNDWQSTIDEAIKGKPGDFKLFIEASNNLFTNKTLYASPSTEWRSSNSNFQFKFDEVPFIMFSNLDLICYSRGDSVKILNTSGKYYPVKNIWVGIGGKVTWEKAGLGSDIVNALLNNYEISINKSQYEADSVIFYNKSMFTASLKGKVSDACRANTSTENASFPRFESYDKKIEIPKLVQNVSYTGGFLMEGSKIIGTGSKDENAVMYFFKNGKKAVFVKCKRLVFADGKIAADDAETSIYIENDSIYHPGLNLKYLVDDKEFAFIRSEKGDFFNSYHQLAMNFEAIYWKFDEPTLQMKTLSGMGEIPAIILSSEFFNKADFLKWGKMLSYNPLGVIASYVKKNGVDEFYTEELAKFMNLSTEAIRPLMMDLSNAGYIYYNYSTETIKVRPKLEHYIKSNAGKKDYDAIYFTSQTQGPNAILDLQTSNLEIRGVPHFYLSDSQNIVVIPDGEKVTLRKNRNAIFSGIVVTNRFDFFGKNFDFNYDDFKIYMDKIDSVKLKMPTGEVDKDGRPVLIYLNSVLEKLSGNLAVDNPKNKSGRNKKVFGNYPIFNSEKDSYVFYDKKTIQKGLYKKNSFYFHVDPFTIDSLESFNISSMQFGGTLVSANIFPNFKESLKVREDNSLGFVSETPQDGYDTYGNKGKYFSTIDLSNRGLRGKGELAYLTSKSQSHDFLFLPDSANFTANLYDMKPGILGNASYPHVSAYETKNHWVPYRDSMYIQMKKDVPIHMFEDEVLLNGNMVLSPKELSGNGVARLLDSELESKYMIFRQKDYHADTSEFRLISIDRDKLAFEARNIIADLDLQGRIGKFQSNDPKSSTVIFPYNEYVSSFKGFTWEMDQKTLGFENPPTADIEDSYFTSIHPKQDSLRFSAPKAVYNLVDYIIYCEKVPEILVADAIIIPESGKVVVEKNAKIRTLTNSKIIANTSTKYHTIYDATVNVLGRKRYRGSGNYDYVTKDNQLKTFYFKEVDVDTSLHTFGIGDIRESMNFILNPRFLYKGKVVLTASEEHLEFKGYVKLDQKHYAVATDWFKIDQRVDPNAMYLKIDKPINEKQEVLFAGMHFMPEPKLEGDQEPYIYPTFLFSKKDKDDGDLITVNGLVTYDEDNNLFRIGDEEKILSNALSGNYLEFNDKKDQIYTEGKLAFGVNLGQVELQTVGNSVYNINDNTTALDIILTLNFLFSEEAMREMANDILKYAFDRPDCNLDRPVFEKNLVELVGPKKGMKLVSEVQLSGNIDKVIPEIKKSFVFTDLQMKWNPSSRSFISIGKKNTVGLGNIDEKLINKKLKGSVEIIRRKDDDIINLYIEPSEGVWYYFRYRKEILEAISSNAKFNEIIQAIKPKNRKAKKVEGVNYQYILSTTKKKTDFVDRVGFAE